MENKKTAGRKKISEEELVSLLGGLKVEPSPEADFEARFLHDFHERVTREAAIQPARKLFWEHLLLKITNFGKMKTVFGASTLGLGVLAIGFMTWTTDEPETASNRVGESLNASESYSATRAATESENSIFFAPVQRKSGDEVIIDMKRSYTLPVHNQGYSTVIDPATFSTLQ